MIYNGDNYNNNNGVQDLFGLSRKKKENRME